MPIAKVLLFSFSASQKNHTFLAQLWDYQNLQLGQMQKFVLKHLHVVIYKRLFTVNTCYAKILVSLFVKFSAILLGIYLGYLLLAMYMLSTLLGPCLSVSVKRDPLLSISE